MRVTEAQNDRVLTKLEFVHGNFKIVEIGCVRFLASWPAYSLLYVE